MFGKAVLAVLLSLFLFSVMALAQSAPKQEELTLPLEQDSAEEASIDSLSDEKKDAESDNDTKVIAYYFHSTRRCATCRKLEEYSREAIEEGFENELEKGLLEINAVNTDEKENKHFIDDYKLYTKALILSKVEDGKEVEWVNLDKIWKLVGDEDKYKAYVTSEVKEFLGDN
ncbi:MAG: hypothetical protein GWO41_15105 [candidate division Zixibacteria bacterium]|nr:hypothetical protein [candidate division Zixibacteria bacterium]NIT54019.1 hypothetical protein [candidate division Zixibacteria bacterium]NIW42461.1 hypothetical protein [candidate division Zixibacteria bacterium]NIX56974.1 hypothetical protein [candidate division Zixibacteria bacterium]